ncbi:MAG: hypothetical protein H8E37_10785 [Planctomycetes bacterium]|nr:hypothetical protein [Planctomycetota bacterium]
MATCHQADGAPSEFSVPTGECLILLGSTKPMRVELEAPQQLLNEALAWLGQQYGIE